MKTLSVLQVGVILLALGCQKAERSDDSGGKFNWFGDKDKSSEKSAKPSLWDRIHAKSSVDSKSEQSTPVESTQKESKHADSESGGSKTGGSITTKSAPSSVSKTKTGSKSYLHLKPVKIYDRMGFGEPIVARTFLAPAKWKVDGGVIWNIRAIREDSIQERFQVTHPDGKARFEKLPQYTWQNSTSPVGIQTLRGMNKRIGSLLTVRQAIDQVFLPRYRQNIQATVKSITPDRKVAEGIEKAMRADYARYPQLRHTTISCEMALAQLEYQIGGQAYEEVVTFRMVTIRRPTIAPEVARFSDGQTHGFVYNCFLDMYAFRAPQGKLDEYQPILSTMLSSMRQNPAWNRAIQRHWNTMNRIDLKGMQDRAEIRRKANAEIAEMRRVGWQKQQASQDRNAAAFTRTIRGVDAYRDPQTGEDIELNHGYDFAYRNHRGEYLITNNALFDPNVELNGTWRKLKKVKD